MSAMAHNGSFFTKLKQTFWSIIGYHTTSKSRSDQPSIRFNMDIENQTARLPFLTRQFIEKQMAILPPVSTGSQHKLIST